MTTDTPMLAAALWYAENNVPVFPIYSTDGDRCGCGNSDCKDQGKHPLSPLAPHGFKDATTDPAKISEWWNEHPRANIAMPTGQRTEIVVLDTDPRNGGPVDRAELIERCGPMPETAEDETGGGGRHYFLRYAGGKVPPNIGPGIDLKGDGGYVLLPPSLHKSGKLYTWDGIEGMKALLHPANIPNWLLKRISTNGNGNGRAAQIEGKIPEGARNTTLTSLAGKMRRPGLSPKAIEAALVTENQLRCDPPLPEAEVRQIAESVSRYEPARADMPTAPEQDLLPFMFNDHGNAQRLIAFHGARLRYCYGFRKWLVWDGRRWVVDDGGRAEKLAKETALEFLTQAVRTGKTDAEKFAKASLEQKRIGTMLASAQCELPITPAELDTRAELLNFLNGSLDLRDGELHPHQPDHFITKLVHHTYNPAAKCPRFLEFLGRIMGAGADASERELYRTDRLIAYLQKAFGYALTGYTSEKAVFLAYGTGSNGKTSLLSLFYDLLREYSCLLQIDTLMVRQESNNSQADLADLRGARFVMTSETEEGQRLAEGKLKRITQGMGSIKAVRKYENPVEFPESHKLFLDCNHRPIVRGTDNAIWNRLHLIPFTVTIPPEEADKGLKTKLMAEAEGILAWAAAGAMRWFHEGLGRPPEVAEAVQEYREEMDHLGRFISECCIKLSTARVKAKLLYATYRKWAEEGGEYAVSQTLFGRRIVEHGFQKTHERDGDLYTGLGLKGGL